MREHIDELMNSGRESTQKSNCGRESGSKGRLTARNEGARTGKRSSIQDTERDVSKDKVEEGRRAIM